jgi:mannose-1-phosphate guanylyltransferase
MAPGFLGIGRPLVTLGIQPAGPETVYGYIRPRRDAGGGALSGIVEVELPGRAEPIRLTTHAVDSFEEKPSLERAEKLCRDGGVYWNAGMFAWTRRAIREAFALDPRAVRTWEAISGAVTRGGSRALETAYERVEAISIDYAVMEPAARAGRVVTSGMDVGWSDLGSWTALLHALDPGGDAPLIGPHVRGHVVEAGEAVETGADDLLVLADGGYLHLECGPRGTMVLGTTGALLSGARPGMALVEALLDRVNRVILEAPAR